MKNFNYLKVNLPLGFDLVHLVHKLDDVKVLELEKNVIYLHLLVHVIEQFTCLSTAGDFRSRGGNGDQFVIYKDNNVTLHGRVRGYIDDDAYELMVWMDLTSYERTITYAPTVTIPMAPSAFL